MKSLGQDSASVDHHIVECVGVHAVRRSKRFGALEPIRRGRRSSRTGTSSGAAPASWTRGLLDVPCWGTFNARWQPGCLSPITGLHPRPRTVAVHDTEIDARSLEGVLDRELISFLDRQLERISLRLLHNREIQLGLIGELSRRPAEQRPRNPDLSPCQHCGSIRPPRVLAVLPGAAPRFETYHQACRVICVSPPRIYRSAAGYSGRQPRWSRPGHAGGLDRFRRALDLQAGGSKVDRIDEFHDAFGRLPHISSGLRREREALSRQRLDQPCCRS